MNDRAIQKMLGYDDDAMTEFETDMAAQVERLSVGTF
jgi:hypothetical protein